ncbi:hypothetical protein H1D32_16940 [Anaerobacillus sp. CMMVII]|uniref:hypothetical protein n=1 Tax=Anaerobacillus sp. CMMVII TaxID=2755588 RepID=UPI0021B819DD|nr:hypothetical protein [Anaerobacillus sp. CMMVII]MCT8139240.1 hypothetical protein [Anaerobacillus sp. CMMVII]
MALPFSITIMLVIFYITFFIIKKLSFLHNSIVFMLMTIVSANFMTIATLQLNLLKISEVPWLYLYLIIDRSILTPLLIVIYLNLRLQMATGSKKVLVLITTIGVMQGLDVLMNYFGAIQFIDWNLFYSFLKNVSFLMIGLGISKLLVILERKGEAYDGYL